MDRSFEIRAVAVVTAAIFILAACTSGATGTPPPTRAIPLGSPPAAMARPSGATPTPTTTPISTAAASPQAVPTPSVQAFRLVLMGDSMFNGVLGAATPVIEAKLGRPVSVQSWLNPDLAKYAVGGERAADLVARLRSDESLRADITAADAVWFDVPLGTMADVCGMPTQSTTPGELKACLPEAVAQTTKDADAMMREVVALRSPKHASIRVMTVWQYFRSTFQAGRTFDQATAAWLEVRQVVKKSAATYGIGVVDGYAVFSGPDGSRDAVAAGDLLSDEVHLTNQGVTRLVELLVASGLAPST